MKNDLSRFVAEVRRGGRVRILVRGVPAADLVPVVRTPGSNASDDAELTELETLGLVRRGTAHRATKDDADLDRPGPKLRGGHGVEALLAERRARR